ncbi:MAG: M56 family metallopeptidase [Bacteroidetes bacterium]|nr:M56 family metallopeptidase [Bacteroidota bacterium]
MTGLSSLEQLTGEVLGHISGSGQSATDDRKKYSVSKSGRAQAVSFGNDSSGMVVSNTSAKQTGEDGPVEPLTLLLLILCAGTVIMIFRLVVNLIRLINHIRHQKYSRESRIFYLPGPVRPFSFLNRIFIPDNVDKNELDNILAHEKIHVSQLHFMDVILIETLLVFQWFNPFAWFIRNAVKENLEFLADRGCIARGLNPEEYQYNLLNHTLKTHGFSLVNGYNELSISRRIGMLRRERSGAASLMKYLVIIPVLLTGILLFSLRCAAPEPEDTVIKYAEEGTRTFVTATGVKINITITRPHHPLLTNVYITTEGMKSDRSMLFADIDSVTGIAIRDLDGNSYSEIFVLTSTGGDECHSNFMGLVSYGDDRLERIGSPSQEDKEKLKRELSGIYNGHDHWEFTDSMIMRVFPVYEEKNGEMFLTGKTGREYCTIRKTDGKYQVKLVRIEIEYEKEDRTEKKMQS